MKKQWIILVSCVFTAAAAAGWMMAQNGTEKAPVMQDVPRITANTDFSLTYYYAMCGHEEKEGKERFIGMDKEELENELANASVKEFSAETVKVRKDLRGYCPRHEIVKLIDGQVCVVGTESGSEEQRIKRRLGITEEQIAPDYLEPLNRGMVATLGRSVRQIADMICGEK